MFGRRLLIARLGPLRRLCAARYSQKPHFKPVIMDLEIPVRPNPIVTRLDSHEFKAIFNDGLRALIDIFKRNDFELRIAGGAVRDLLLHKTPTDLDFATNATPTQMKEIFSAAEIRMINTNGEKHGTVTPRLCDAQFEVTTLRIDTATNGRHAEVEFTTDWQVDAGRRDLTINSMFCDLDGNVYDYYYGYDDLQKRRVRFVGAPEQRIREDYLRILRYFRFYGRTADEPDAHDERTLRAIADNIEGLQKMSGERIWGEVKKIVQGRFAEQLVLKLVDCGAASFMGLPAEPNREQFRRVCETNRRCAQAEMNPITLLAGLLESEEDAFRLHQRLKLSAYERDLAKFLMVNKDVQDTELLYYQKECFNTLGTAGLRKAMLIELLKFNGHIDLATQLAAWTIPTYPINGDLLRANGCPGGAEMGQIQRRLRDHWKESEFQLTEENLLALLPDAIEKVRSEVKPSPPKRHKASKQ